jgi:hypothetical protein
MELLSDIITILKIIYHKSLIFNTITTSIYWDQIYKIVNETSIELDDQNTIVYNSNAITIRTHKFSYNFRSSTGFTIRMLLDNILEIIKKHPPRYYDSLLTYDWYFNGLVFNIYDQCWDVVWTRKNTDIEDTPDLLQKVKAVRSQLYL